MSDLDTIELVKNIDVDKYKYGFTTDIESEKAPKGLNEEIVGRALARTGVARERIQLSTKFGYVLDRDRSSHGESERPHDWSPQHTRRALEASLRRLGTDYVDLYQLHNPRMDGIHSDELFETLEGLRSEGKIRHYGVALGPNAT